RGGFRGGRAKDEKRERVPRVPSSTMPTRKMLVGGEKFRMGGAGRGGGCGDGEGGFDVESYRWQTDFVAAGLVAELERNFLRSEWCVGLGSERHAKDDFVFVHVQG